MSYARQLLDTYPGTLYADAGVLTAAIDALSDCAQACIADADADLSEQNLAEMVTCIRLCLDCADVCTATAAVTSRQTAYDATITRPLLEACRNRKPCCRERINQSQRVSFSSNEWQDGLHDWATAAHSVGRLKRPP